MRIYELNNDGSNLIKKLEGHNDITLKVIIYKNKLISCSRDKTMKIWEKKEENNYNCIKSIIISDNSGKNTNILQINENKLVSSAVDSNYIKFFDIKKDFDEITTIKNISVNWCWNSMELFKENKYFFYLLILPKFENFLHYLHRLCLKTFPQNIKKIISKNEMIK